MSWLNERGYLFSQRPDDSWDGELWLSAHSIRARFGSVPQPRCARVAWITHVELTQTTHDLTYVATLSLLAPAYFLESTEILALSWCLRDAFQMILSDNGEPWWRMERTQAKQKKEERTTNGWKITGCIRLEASEGSAAKSPSAAEADKVFN